MDPSIPATISYRLISANNFPMLAREILPVLNQHLGFKLTLIEDIQAHFDDPNRYPDSYREVMTLEEEMAGSMYSKHAFSDQDGRLVGLNLFGCEVGDEQVKFFNDPDIVPYFEPLLSLNLSQTSITRFALSEALPSLVYAAFNECKNLERFTCAKGLSNLARLEITETAIKRLQIPEGYTRLYYLDLASNTKLEAFRFADSCPSLQLLFLRGTAITSFTLPEGFEELVHLYLNNNQLTELTLNSKLPKLSTLQLRDNNLSNIAEQVLTLSPNLDSLFVGNNPLPEELSFRLENISDQNHLSHVKAYFAQRKIGTPQPNNECKVLLIGNGKAGKSAIVNRIVNDDFDPDWNSTHGISLFRKELGSYLINIWDFGGQDIYHATHRLFMQKNAIYILAWSLETEKYFTPHKIPQSDGSVVIRNYKNYGLRYWLEYAKHLGKGSPMNVVQTKIGADEIVDKSKLAASYRDDFEPEMSFHAVESSEDDPFESGYENLLKDLQAQVVYLKRDHTTLAEPLHKIREFLREKQEAGDKIMEYAVYEKQALEFKVQDPRGTLETWLYKSGIVYYKPGRFQDKIILNQGWAIEAIYTLFNRSKNIPYEIEARKGIFDGAFLQNLWSPKYPDPDDHELFINFMKSCDLCFEIEGEEKYSSFKDRVFMAPQLVQRRRPEFIDDFWEERDTLHYRFYDDFIHEGIIHSFITQTAYLAKLREIWRVGIQIREGKQYACIEAGKNEIRIRLTLNAQPLLQKIRNSLRKLQGEAGKEEISRDGIHFDALKADSFIWPGAEREGGISRKDFLPEPERGFYLSEEASTPHESAFKSSEPLKASETDKSFVEEAQNQEVGTKLREDAPRKTILFASAHPRKTERMAIDYELRQLIDELIKGKARDHFEFLHPTMALDKSNFLRIEDHKPFILHFSGHGGPEGILIQDGHNNPLPLSNDFLDYFFKDLRGITELVVLNSCLSENQSQIIAQHIPYVVGTNQKVRDKDAIAFSEGLYNGLGEGKDIPSAIKRGLKSVAVGNFQAKEVFQAWYKGELIHF